MWVPTDWAESLLNTAGPLLPLSVFALSLLGSPHCLGMCGVFCVSQKQLGYHFGRLSSYLALGALAGLLGQKILAENRKSLLLVAGVLLGASLITTGISLLMDWKLSHKLQMPYGRFLSWVAQWPKGIQSYGVGVASALLPCGWLYVFVLGAVATQSFWLGGTILLFFWLGTVPTLAFSTFLVKRGWSKIQFHRPLRVGVACLFILYGAAVVKTRWPSGGPDVPTPVCHP